MGYGFITNFTIYLRFNCRCEHKTEVTCAIQLTIEALKSRLIHIDLFLDIPLSSKKGHREFLTEEELRIIINQRFASEIQKETRDVFVFSFTTRFVRVFGYPLIWIRYSETIQKQIRNIFIYWQAFPG